MISMLGQRSPKSWHIVKHWWSIGCVEYFCVFAEKLYHDEPIELYEDDDIVDPYILYDGDFEVIAGGLDELTALNLISTDMPAEIGLYFSYPALD